MNSGKPREIFISIAPLGNLTWSNQILTRANEWFDQGK